ncbi:MAG TPA: 16S rRNA (cytosine(1402)-N(4))-methyltransferase RsmH [Syntrophomonadaceae bacterium]|nr:16S rRNA (cytosine(1402)-N(4))-methyltransferase RsmH [Syntrophomonadaceae bacterium]
MHQPVLLHQTIDYLLNDPHGTYVDCTVGGGGHLGALLPKLATDARIIALDKDLKVMETTRQNFPYDNVHFVQADFRDLASTLKEAGIEQVDGILLDLGVSSFQLDDPQRGFSFHEDAYLDMRMNQNQELNAWEIVNNWQESELKTILRDYGEERFASSIARAIVRARQQDPIDSTLKLVEIIRQAVPARYCRAKHPGRKTFQALRIAVNQELEALREVLPQGLQCLKKGGRLCVISFHSLEDRIVKRFFQDQARTCVCPPGLPVCVCKHQAQMQVITKRPVIPTDEECEVNPRARSARLRVACRL